MPDSDLFQQALAAIPSHLEDARSIEQIASGIAISSSVDHQVSLQTTKAVITVLDLFDALEHVGDRVRIRSQIPNYFRLSLLWYIRHQQKLLVNWNRDGTARDIRVSQLLDRAPYFLKALEERRQQLGLLQNLDPEPTRVQPISVVFIKAEINGKTYFLYQWDQPAERYQPIGGKKRDHESHLETAVREFREEMAEHDLIYGTDFTIDALVDAPIMETELSRTYGSLTRYEISVYQANFRKSSLSIGVSDRWISTSEIAKLQTNDGKDISPISRTLEALKPGLLERIPYSIRMTSKRRFRFLENVEVRPGMFGIRIDLKRLFFGKDKDKS